MRSFKENPKSNQRNTEKGSKARRAVVTRERMFNIATTTWAIALAILVLLYATGATPAFARGRGLDCGTACISFCLMEESSACDGVYDNGGGCSVTCSNGHTEWMPCPNS